MRKLIGLAFIIAMSAPLPAFAQSQEDQAACTPDVMRLCQQAIPDRGRRRRLSGAKQAAAQPCVCRRVRPRAYGECPQDETLKPGL